MSRPTFTVTQVTFAEAEAEIRAIRHEVFVQGQDVPEPEEWDGRDPRCDHVVARLPDGTPIGTARLCDAKKIGRMAVRAPWRGAGVGSALLTALVELAQHRGASKCTLAAQLQAIPFYARHGFQEHGPVFLDAGIEHRQMTRHLTGD